MAARKPVPNIIEWRGVKLRHQARAADFDGGSHVWIADHLARRPFVAVTLEVFNLLWTDVRWSADIRMDAGWRDYVTGHGKTAKAALEAAWRVALKRSRAEVAWDEKTSASKAKAKK